MNSQLTDELIDTLKGIREGKEWEIKVAGAWVKPGTDKLWAWLNGGYEIRLKPFVPEPPEGYRLLTEEDRHGQWIKGGKWWSKCRKEWKTRLCEAGNGEQGCSANIWDTIAVPLEPPAPEYVPWTFETRPEGVVWVTPKKACGCSSWMIIGWGAVDVNIGGHGFRPYQSLFDDWTLTSGEPCGAIKQ